MVARLVDAHVEFESVENESRTRWPLAELELVSVSSPTTASAGTKPQAANYAVSNAAMYGGAPQRVIAGAQKTDEAVPVTFKRTNHAEEKCASAHMWCFTQCGPADGTREMPRQVHPAREQLLLPGRAAHRAGIAERSGSPFASVVRPGAQLLASWRFGRAGA
jgi:hypothetical protein